MTILFLSQGLAYTSKQVGLRWSLMTFNNFLQNFYMDNHHKGQTTLTERVMLVHLWLSGLSYNAIAHQTGICLTTVSRWVTRWRQEGHVNQRRCGRRHDSTKKQTNILLQDRYETSALWKNNSYSHNL